MENPNPDIEFTGRKIERWTFLGYIFTIRNEKNINQLLKTECNGSDLGQNISQLLLVEFPVSYFIARFHPDLCLLLELTSSRLRRCCFAANLVLPPSSRLLPTE